MLDPTTPIRAIVVDPRARDKALDDDIAAIREYIRTRDIDKAKLISGIEPAEFILEPLDVIFLAQEIDSEPAESIRRTKAFSASCRSVKCGADTIKPERLIQGRYGTQLAPDDFIREVAAKYTMHAVYEMGDVAIQRARLGAAAAGPFGWSGI